MPCTILGIYDYKHANVFESIKNINIKKIVDTACDERNVTSRSV